MIGVTRNYGEVEIDKPVRDASMSDTARVGNIFAYLSHTQTSYLLVLIAVRFNDHRWIMN